MSSKSEKNNDSLFQIIANSFNSMPMYIKEGTIIALIAGFLYFGILQKIFLHIKEVDEISLMQANIKLMNIRIETIEQDHIDSYELIEFIDDIEDLFEISEEAERNRTMNMLKFMKEIKPLYKDNKFITEFEEEDARIQSIYEEKYNKIFNNRMKERINKKHSKQNNKNK